MIFAKRIRSILLGISLLFLIVHVVRFRSSRTSFKGLPQLVDLRKFIKDEQEGMDRRFSDSTMSRTQDSHSPHPELRTGGLEVPDTVFSEGIVTGRLSEEDTTWLEGLDFPNMQKFVYVVDDPTAPLHVPTNKGNEAMVYLTFIIDHYDILPDVTMFMHSHRLAWHTNELLNYDALEIIKRLSRERVIREGYMNLRCHWDPGCPERIHPATVPKSSKNLEDAAVADVWEALFPGEPLPTSLGAPCCAQFAVSKDKILSIPKKRYQFLRNWLLETSLDNWTSGRVFEYLWQKIFNNQAQHCPDMRICYCDGYGVCFPDPKEFDYWFELRYKQRQAEKELREWKREAELLNSIDNGRKKDLKLETPQPGKDVVLQRDIDSLFEELQRRRLEALKLGVDPRIRAEVAGRIWNEGDGY